MLVSMGYMKKRKKILKKSEDECIAMFDIWKPENQVDSRLVWLPVTFNSDGTISIKWK